MPASKTRLPASQTTEGAAWVVILTATSWLIFPFTARAWCEMRMKKTV